MQLRLGLGFILDTLTLGRWLQKWSYPACPGDHGPRAGNMGSPRTRQKVLLSLNIAGQNQFSDSAGGDIHSIDISQLDEPLHQQPSRRTL